MKKIINGKRYDTESAKEMGCFYNTLDIKDFAWCQETLYRKRTGEFFLHGEGGPMTRYASRAGNAWTYGEMITPLSPEEAMKWAEEHLTAEEWEEIFGNLEEDDSKRIVTYSLPIRTIEKIKRTAAERGISFSEIVAEAIDAL